MDFEFLIDTFNKVADVGYPKKDDIYWYIWQDPLGDYPIGFGGYISEEHQFYNCCTGELWTSEKMVVAWALEEEGKVITIEDDN